jgi:aminopeptidase N
MNKGKKKKCDKFCRKYKSATPDDLWQALQKCIDAARDPKLNISVATVMKTWTEQPGFPYVSVTIKRNYITLSQQRFLLRNPNTVPTDSTWWVPITWTSSSQANSTSESTKPVYWLSQRNAEIPNENEDADWMIINVQSTGW